MAYSIQLDNVSRQELEVLEKLFEKERLHLSKEVISEPRNKTEVVVKIVAPAGCGKTTLAALLRDLFIKFGVEVSVHDEDLPSDGGRPQDYDKKIKALVDKIKVKVETHQASRGGLAGVKTKCNICKDPNCPEPNQKH
jgi:predicted AAA+ superfamily ATPase